MKYNGWTVIMDWLEKTIVYSRHPFLIKDNW